MEEKRIVLLRRSFLAGLVLAVSACALDETTPDAQDASDELRTSVFLHIAADGKDPERR